MSRRHSNPAANRLIHEHSPYLLQHAYNPVEWYPWGDKAFDQAAADDKPIFLSIGYSTCHWCHVMEAECFEDEEVARLLNRHFVSIKVDREERPDIDHVYMTISRLMSGRGGWPLTIILTPHRQPFYAATYIPKHSRGSNPGMMEILPAIEEAWRERREELVQSAGRIIAALQQVNDHSPEEPPTHDAAAEIATMHDAATYYATVYESVREYMVEAERRLLVSFDREYGGFGDAPKFPMAHNLLFLLRRHHHTGSTEALEAVVTTLRNMRLGGIWDHIGFGFHRYATDRNWLVAHFEKMLYDQAMLAVAFLETFEATGIDSFSRTAKEILHYCIRDMQDRGGAFYSAEDADSEGEEGIFYTWTTSELDDLLGDEAEWVKDRFGCTLSGNYYEDAGGYPTGRNILHLQAEPTPDEHTRWEELRARLYEAREGRTRPHLDDKILTDWNGLMIHALAKAGRVLGDRTLTTAASSAARFILDRLVDDSGRLLHRFRRDHTGIAAGLDDYAFLVFGLLELYRSTARTEWLAESIRWTDRMIAECLDEESGGFYMTPAGDEELPVRPKVRFDGALPSGNSVASFDLYRIYSLTGNESYRRIADDLAAYMSSSLRQAPEAITMLLCALHLAASPTTEVVLVGDITAADTREMIDALDSGYRPNLSIHVKSPTDETLSRLAPYTESYTQQEGRTTAYVCRNFTCSLPTTDVSQMLRDIDT